MIDFELDFQYENEKIPALRNVKGRIEDGKCIVLCGGSGSGKWDLLYIRAVLAPENAEEFGIELKTGGDKDRSWYSYNMGEGTITGDTKNKGSAASTNHVSGDLSMEDGKLSMEIYVDRSLVEAFFNDEKLISMRAYSEFGSQGVQLFADGDVNVDELYVAEMNGIY